MTRTFTGKRVLLAVLAAVALVVCAATIRDGVSAMRVDNAVRDLKSGDPVVREAAIARLAGLRREKDLRRLVGHLGSTDTRVTDGIIEAVRRIGAPAARPLADELVAASSPSLRWRLGRFIPISKLRERVLNMEDVYRRNNFPIDAENAFLKIGQPCVSELFALAGMGGDLRQIAFSTMSGIAAPECLDTFLANTRDTERAIRLDAVEGLWFLKESCPSNLPADPGKAAEWRTYESREAKAVEALITATEDADVWVRREACNGLMWYRKDSRAFERLLALAQKTDVDAKMRADALTNIQTSADPRVFDAMAAAFVDPDAVVRDSAWRDVSYSKDARKWPFLIGALTDDKSVIHDRATRYFANSWDKGKARALAAAYGTASDTARAAIVRALEHIRDVPTVKRGDPQRWLDIDAQLHKDARDALAQIESSGLGVESTEAAR